MWERGGKEVCGSVRKYDCADDEGNGVVMV